MTVNPLFDKVKKNSFSDHPGMNHAVRLPPQQRTPEDVALLGQWLSRRPEFQYFSRHQVQLLVKDMEVVTVRSGQRMFMRPGHLYIQLTGSILLIDGDSLASLSLRVSSANDIVGHQEWKRLLDGAAHSATNMAADVAGRLQNLVLDTRNRLRGRRGSVAQSMRSVVSTASSSTSGGSQQHQMVEAMLQEWQAKDVGPRTARRRSIMSCAGQVDMMPLLARLGVNSQVRTAAALRRGKFNVVDKRTLAVVPHDSHAATGGSKAMKRRLDSLRLLSEGASFVRIGVTSLASELPRHDAAQTRVIAEFLLSNVRCFRKWHLHQLGQLSKCLDVRTFVAGAELWKQDDVAEDVMVVQTGAVELRTLVAVTHRNKWPTHAGTHCRGVTTTRSVVVARAGVGEVIGAEVQ